MSAACRPLPGDRDCAGSGPAGSPRQLARSEVGRRGPGARACGLWEVRRETGTCTLSQAGSTASEAFFSHLYIRQLRSEPGQFDQAQLFCSGSSPGGQWSEAGEDGFVLLPHPRFRSVVGESVMESRYTALTFTNKQAPSRSETRRPVGELANCKPPRPLDILFTSNRKGSF